MKQHFDVLDGLRGTAALLVVLFHLLEVVFPQYTANPLRHAYLAVDFFFLLSGFVVAYAYDERWTTLRVGDFLCLRLIRLHPLVLFSTAIGGLCYYFDPFVGQAQQVGGLRLTVCCFLGALLLPAPVLSNRGVLTHPLNAPCWSLLQEYVANIAYAFVGSRLSRRGLQLLVALSAVALTGTAAWHWNLHGGWDWNTWWMAPIRVTFPFFAGLLLYRQGVRVQLPHAYAWLSGLLLLVFAAPASRVNGYYEAGCVIVVFPFIVAAGAGSQSTGWLKGVCRYSGLLSYPLYLMHFPFVQVYGHWIAARHPSTGQLLAVAALLSVFFLGLAWAALHWYDEPVRAWLTAYNKRRQQKKLVHIT